VIGLLDKPRGRDATHGGSTSFQRASRLAECWRDLHVVGQTVTIAPEWYPLGGRVYLGMDPGPRLR
jgi:hypothetical protein